MPLRIPRCPICFNAGWHDRAPVRACTHCELELLPDAAPDRVPAEIAASLPQAGRAELRGRHWRLSGVALRNAAWSIGRSWRDGGWQREEAGEHAVVLGVIGRPSDLPAIERMAATGGFSRAAAVLDGDGAAPHGDGVRVAMRPLAGDFASQRNHLQTMAQAQFGPNCWVLQLDTDEAPSDALLGALGWMCRAADRDGLRSVGLPRINRVDGVRSALFPDIQYRLNRADIRFGGIVHERPVVPFNDTTLGLHGAIEHALSRERVLARSVLYEGMRAGAGRRGDERALLLPFEAASMPAA